MIMADDSKESIYDVGPDLEATCIRIDYDALTSWERQVAGMDPRLFSGEPLTSSKLSMSDISHLFPVSGVDIPSEGPRRADDITTDSLTAHLLGHMTEIDVNDIHKILERDVPGTVHTWCSQNRDLLCQILQTAQQKCGMEIQENGNHKIPTEFYEALTEELMRDEYITRDTKLNDVILSLNYVAQISMRNTDLGSGECHGAWTVFVADLLKLVTNEQICLTNETRVASIRSSGHGNLSFPIKCTPTQSHWLHCTPDSVVELRQRRKINKDQKKLLIQITHPVLTVEVDARCTQTDSSAEPAYEKHFISCTDRDKVSPCDLSDPDSHMTNRTRKLSMNTLENSDDNSDCSDKINTRSVRDRPQYAKTRNKKEPKLTENSSRLEMNNERLMSVLKGHHRVQLIGMLKWSCLLKSSLFRKMHAPKRGQVDMNTRKNLSSYGLFLSQNHLYLTKLSVKQKSDDSSISNKTRNVFVSHLGDLAMSDDIKELCEDYSMEYVVSDVFLDIFDPVHLKALLVYLCVIIWHEQKYVFSD